jgi:hypothetical protein
MQQIQRSKQAVRRPQETIDDNPDLSELHERLGSLIASATTVLAEINRQT